MNKPCAPLDYQGKIGEYYIWSDFAKLDSKRLPSVEVNILETDNAEEVGEKTIAAINKDKHE